MMSSQHSGSTGQPSGVLPVVEISTRAARQLEGGYRWVFANEVDMKTIPEEKGAWCWFACRGSVVGTGYANRHSLIAGRVVSSSQESEIEHVLSARLKGALERRRNLVQRGSARLVFSESDSIPGLIVDWYGNTVVFQSNTAGVDTVVPLLEKLIPSVFSQVFGQEIDNLVVRADTAARHQESVETYSRVVSGDEGSVVCGWVSEDGLWIAADFLRGQKTGFFLDQRDNRAFLESRVTPERAPSVLDLCCYSGAWGLRALRAGAGTVTFVDQSADALELVRRSLEKNGIEPHKGRLVRDNVFEFLQADPNTYDFIVADPPAFVKSKKDLPKARKAYEKLNRLAWRRLAPGGTLFSCSCSYHMQPMFLDMLRTAVSKESGDAQVIYRGGQAQDHPVLLAMPETSYLKCCGIRKIC